VNNYDETPNKNLNTNNIICVILIGNNTRFSTSPTFTAFSGTGEERRQISPAFRIFDRII